MDLAALTLGEVLGVHAALGSELKARGVSRTGNNSCADYAELLVGRAFGWQRNGNSTAGHDLVTSPAAGAARIEVKARRLTTPRGSRQLSALRRLEHRPFDRLIGILFNADYAVMLALDIPVDVVVARARHSSHTNSGIFHLRDDLRREPGMIDVTASLRRVSQALLSEGGRIA